MKKSIREKEYSAACTNSEEKSNLHVLADGACTSMSAIKIIQDACIVDAHREDYILSCWNAMRHEKKIRKYVFFYFKRSNRCGYIQLCLTEIQVIFCQLQIQDRSELR